jgi:hypothetical protein
MLGKYRCAMAAAVLVGAAGGAANGQITTVPTMDPTALGAALNASGLTITSVSIRNGQTGQFGTYSHFTALPVTIRDGVVLSSGNVTSIGPLVEVLDPAYDPWSPPGAVNSWMDIEHDGNTSEFDDYGLVPGHIENFQGSFDVAALDVRFTLSQPSQIQFDFVFGSVEFPKYTSSFTDAFVVFLDGTTPDDQIAFDLGDAAVQVGESFSARTTTADTNTAFAAPHGLINHLTTTSAVLPAGSHRLIFEVGDVNDHALDSAVFIANLRAGAGTIGTEPSDDCRADFNDNGTLEVQDIFDFLNEWFDGERDADFNSNRVLEVADVFAFLNAWFAGCTHE